jgi:hypothetical protein
VWLIGELSVGSQRETFFKWYSVCSLGGSVADPVTGALERRAIIKVTSNCLLIRVARAVRFAVSRTDARTGGPLPPNRSVDSAHLTTRHW